MSDELYYRGSSSYETAVKNRLNELERSGVKNTAAMLTGLQDMEYGIRGEIKEKAEAAHHAADKLHSKTEKKILLKFLLSL